jgi:hypothetical protein
LSPISASATVVVEIRKVCMKAPAGWESVDAMVHGVSSQPGHDTHEPKVSPDRIPVARATA